VLVKPGVYAGNDGFRDAAATATGLIVEPWPGTTGRIVSSRHQTGLSWALTATRTNTYQATITTVGSVLDTTQTDANGDYEGYNLVGSIDAVEATAGTYFVSGTTVYVHQIGGDIPGTNIRVNPNIRNAKYHTANGWAWFKGIDFEGGRHPFHQVSQAPGTSNQCWFWDCSFKYSSGTSGENGFESGGQCYSYFRGCIAAKNLFDGFNYYNIIDGVGGFNGPPRFVEIDCIGRGNGYKAAGDTHNGSTSHTEGRGIRINGIYTGNKNRAVHDVNDSKTLNFGCTAGGSTGANNAVAFASGTGTDATEIWLYDCTALPRSGAGTGFDLESVTGSTIYTRNLDPASPSSVPGTTVVPV